MCEAGGEEIQNLTSGFLLGQTHTLLGAATELRTVDYKRGSDGNMLDGWVTNSTQQWSRWDGRQDHLGWDLPSGGDQNHHWPARDCSIAFDTLEKGLFSVEKRSHNRTNQLLREAYCNEVLSHRVRLGLILHFVAQTNERCPKPCSSSAHMRRDCTSHKVGSKKRARTGTEKVNTMVSPQVRTRHGEAKIEPKGSSNDFDSSD